MNLRSAGIDRSPQLEKRSFCEKLPDLQRRTDGENFFFYSNVDTIENKFTDIKIKPFKTYRYKIRAV